MPASVWRNSDDTKRLTRGTELDSVDPMIQGVLAVALRAFVRSALRPLGAGVWVLALALVACQEPSPDAMEAPSSDAAPPAPERTPVLDPNPPYFSPLGGSPGSEVELWMEGLPAESRVMIGFGTVEGHQVLGEAAVDEAGRLETRVQVPESIEANRSHYFFVADPATQQPMTVSGPFHVTDPEGGVEILGLGIQVEGEDCPTLLGAEDEVYTLVGDVPAFGVEDHVRVTGTLAEGSPCGVGLTVAVSEGRVLP